MEAFADVVHSGKAHYIGVSEWRAEEIRAAHELARELHIPLVSNQPQYSMLWRVIEAEVVPTSEELGLGQIVWSPIAQGVLTGKYKPGEELPAGSRATDEKGGADMIKRFLDDDVLTRVQQLVPAGRRGRAVHGAARRGVGAAERQRVAPRSSGPRVPSRSPTTSAPPGSPSRTTCWRRSTRSSATASSATRPRPSRRAKRDFG